MPCPDFRIIYVLNGKEIVFKKSLMINKLLSKLSFNCENLISHIEDLGKCKKPELISNDKYREKYLEALEKIKQLESENSELKNKIESIEYKFKFSEEKNNETIKFLKSMNDILLKGEKDNKDMLMRSIELSESFKKKCSLNTNYSDHTLEEKRNDAKFKSKYHIHELTYQKPVNYNSSNCDICRRAIFDIKNYHCSLCGFDVCPTCKFI